MRWLKGLYLLLGLGLLALVLHDVDLAQVAARVGQVGWGILVVLGLYLLAFVFDSLSWLLTVGSLPVDGRWLYRLWKVRMVGEAFNAVIPAGGMGGEPVKAVLLKRHYGVGYREGTASLILAKTINLLALIVFLGGGFAFLIASPAMPASLKSVAGAGLTALVVGIGLFFLVQRFKISSATGSRLSRWRIARRLDEVLHLIHDVDERLVAFYTRRRGRFAVAATLGLINWFLGVLEVYAAMAFLGHPVSFTEAWMIEAVAQLVRAGTFFIPISLGAQEGGFLIVCTAITGSPTLGVAVAVVRRFRELVWILSGLAMGAGFSWRPAAAEKE